VRRLHAAGLSGPRGGGAPTGARARAQAAEGAGAGAGGLPAGAQVTLGFNRVRIREAAAQPTAAAAEYRGILAAFPGYTDARLRCAALARARGDLEAAVAEAQARPAGPALQGRSDSPALDHCVVPLAASCA